MTCMDIIKQLNTKDRAECWIQFSKLSRVFMLKDKNNAEAVSEFKASASEINSIFIKNGFDSYFDVDVSDTKFLESIFTELGKIKMQPKLKD